MTRETLAMLLSLACLPAILLTLFGVLPAALPAWSAAWITLLLTTRKSP